MSKQPLPAIATTGVRTGVIGTAIWGVLSVISFVFPDFYAVLGITEGRQICLAGFVLGIIGTTHVTLRAKRLGQLP